MVPYLLSAFPGCLDRDMIELGKWLRRRGWQPRQVQCFVPTPGTVATAMFYTEMDEHGRPINVAKEVAQRKKAARFAVFAAGQGPPERATTAPKTIRGARNADSRASVPQLARINNCIMLKKIALKRIGRILPASKGSFWGQHEPHLFALWNRSGGRQVCLRRLRQGHPPGRPNTLPPCPDFNPNTHKRKGWLAPEEPKSKNRITQLNCFAFKIANRMAPFPAWRWLAAISINS